MSPTLAGLSGDAEELLLALTGGDTRRQRDLAFSLWGVDPGAIRRVQSATQELRLAGWPLVSDGDGMRLSDSPSEVRACVAALRRRALTQLRTYRALRRTAAQMEQPRTLWEQSS